MRVLGVSALEIGPPCWQGFQKVPTNLDCTQCVLVMPCRVCVQVLLSALWAEKRKQHPVRSIFSALPAPQLTFRAGPLPTRPQPILPYR